MFPPCCLVQKLGLPTAGIFGVSRASTSDASSAYSVSHGKIKSPTRTSYIVPTPAASRQALLGGNCDGLDILSVCPITAYPGRSSMGRYTQPTGASLQGPPQGDHEKLWHQPWSPGNNSCQPPGMEFCMRSGGPTDRITARRTQNCATSAQTPTCTATTTPIPRLSTHMSRLRQDTWLPDWAS